MRQPRCPLCYGEGMLPAKDAGECTMCHGSGRVPAASAQCETSWPGEDGERHQCFLPAGHKGDEHPCGAPRCASSIEFVPLTEMAVLF